MLNYKERKNFINQVEENLHLFLYVMENDYEHTEQELTEGVNDWLEKAGLKLHKGKGLVNYLADFTKGAGKLIMAAVKGNKQEVKKLSSSIDKAEVIDFLLKLDMATFHIVMGPIHFIDAVTGWDLKANLKQHVSKAKDYLAAFKEAIKKVKESITKIATGHKKQRLIQHVDFLDKSVADATS